MFQEMKVDPTPAKSAKLAEGDKPTRRVGYKSPPVHTQFQKGRSGNPKGRRKRAMAKDLRVVFEKILVEEIPITQGGRVRKITTLEAIMRAVSNSALATHPKTVRRLCRLGARMGMLTRRELHSDVPFALFFPGSPEEEAALAKYRAEKAQRAEQLRAEQDLQAAHGVGSTNEERT